MANLRILSGEQKDTVFGLEGSRITLGRETDNTISLESSEVSRHHAELVLDQYQYKIRDLDSTNGTFINGERASEGILRDGDQIGFGNFQLLYEKKTNKSTIQIQLRPRLNDNTADDSSDSPAKDHEQNQSSSIPSNKSKRSISQSASSLKPESKSTLAHSDSISRIEPKKNAPRQSVSATPETADDRPVSTTQAPKKVRRTKASKQSSSSSASSKARGTKKRKTAEPVAEKSQSEVVASETQETEPKANGYGHKDSSPESAANQERKNTIQIKVGPLLTNGIGQEKNPSIFAATPETHSSSSEEDIADSSPPKVLRLTSTVPSVPPPDNEARVTSAINRQRAKEELRSSAAQHLNSRSQSNFPTLRQPDSSQDSPIKKLGMTLNPLERRPVEVRYPKGWESAPGQLLSANRQNPKKLWTLCAIMTTVGIPLLITGYRIQSDPAKFFGVVMTMLGLLFGVYAWTALGTKN